MHSFCLDFMFATPLLKFFSRKFKQNFHFSFNIIGVFKYPLCRGKSWKAFSYQNRQNYIQSVPPSITNSMYYCFFITVKFPRDFSLNIDPTNSTKCYFFYWFFKNKKNIMGKWFIMRSWEKRLLWKSAIRLRHARSCAANILSCKKKSAKWLLQLLLYTF